MIRASVDFLVRNKDLATILLSLLGVVLTIVGWIAVFWLGLWQQKKQLQNTAKMKVYEELFSLKENIDSQSEGLSLLLGTYGLPFLNMSFEKNPSNIVDGNSKALKLWQDYLTKLSEATHNFTRAYLRLWVHSDMWVGTMPQIKVAKEELFTKQLRKLSDELYEHHRYLQNQSIQEFYWERWNKEEIEQKSEVIRSRFDEIAISYLDDYMGLIHNRLITPIFGHKKIPREGFANMDKLEKYYILTEEGLQEIVNKKPQL